MNISNTKLIAFVLVSTVLFILVPVSFLFSHNIMVRILLAFIAISFVLGVPIVVFKLIYLKANSITTIMVTILSTVIPALINESMFDYKIRRCLEDGSCSIKAVVYEREFSRGGYHYKAKYNYNNIEYKTWRHLDYNKIISIGDSIDVEISTVEPMVYVLDNDQLALCRISTSAWVIHFLGRDLCSLLVFSSDGLFCLNIFMVFPRMPFQIEFNLL